MFRGEPGQRTLGASGLIWKNWGPDLPQYWQGHLFLSATCLIVAMYSVFFGKLGEYPVGPKQFSTLCSRWGEVQGPGMGKKLPVSQERFLEDLLEQVCHTKGFAIHGAQVSVLVPACLHSLPLLGHNENTGTRDSSYRDYSTKFFISCVTIGRQGNVNARSLPKTEKENGAKQNWSGKLNLESCVRLLGSPCCSCLVGCLIRAGMIDRVSTDSLLTLFPWLLRPHRLNFLGGESRGEGIMTSRLPSRRHLHCPCPCLVVAVHGELALGDGGGRSKITHLAT